MEIWAFRYVTSDMNLKNPIRMNRSRSFIEPILKAERSVAMATAMIPNVVRPNLTKAISMALIPNSFKARMGTPRKPKTMAPAATMAMAPFSFPIMLTLVGCAVPFIDFR